jgi:hypothetical protein
MFFKNFIPNFVSYVFTGYGYRVVNFLIAFVIGFIVFFIINRFNWNRYEMKQRDLKIESFVADSSNFSSNFYFTLDATTKLVDCQFQPSSNYGMLLFTVQGVFGFILLSALISILTNKYVK